MITPSFSLTATERVLPRLALDFTTASLDPRITFTRSENTATVVNSSGLVAPINADLPRFDFDPITLVCKGLLIEEARTNLNIRSEDFNSTDYSWAGATVSFDQIAAPDGTTTADILIENSATSTHRISQTIATAPAAVAHSVFVKNAGRRYFQLFTGNNTTSFVTFDLQTGTVTRVGSSIVSSSIQNYGNGWYRCTAVYSANSTLFYYGLANSSTAAFNPSYAGDGSSGVYLWGAQVEAGAFATSYIPTTTTALTRNADVATMTGTNFSSWYNQTAGSFEMQVLKSVGVSGRVFVVDTGGSGGLTANGYGVDILSGNTFRSEGFASSSNQWTFTLTFTLGSVQQVCLGYVSNNIGYATNGGVISTDTSANIPTVSGMSIGCWRTTQPDQINGWVQKLNYWPQRLTNAELQAFSK